MQLQDGYNQLTTSPIDAITVNRSDEGEGSVTATDRRSLDRASCKSCLAGCWRMIAGGVRDVRNYFSHISLCREVGNSGAGNVQYQKVVSERSSSIMSPGDGAHSTEKNNPSIAKDQLVLISKLSPLFSENDQKVINSLNSEMSTAKASSLKEGCALSTDAAANPVSHYASEVETLKTALEQILGKMLKKNTVGKGIKDSSQAAVKALSISLDSFNFEELIGLCQAINIPDNLIMLFNSKLLKAKMIEFINYGEREMFRVPGKLSALNDLVDLFKGQLLATRENSNEIPILNDSKVVSSYIAKQLSAGGLMCTEKEVLEKKLKALKNPVDQAHYVDILEIIYRQCEAAKQVSEEKAISDSVLSFSGFVRAIGPSICAGRLVAKSWKALPDEAQLIAIWTKDLETFMKAWPEVRDGWKSKQGRSQ